MHAANRSAGDRLHCRSPELLLIWLAKPVLVALAMASFPERRRFAWVDAGFNAYRRRSKPVPPAPWLRPRLWPERGLAVRFHPKACKPPHIRPARDGACVQGTYLYGARQSWERFNAAYLARIAQLVRAQEEWGSRRAAP